MACNIDDLEYIGIKLLALPDDSTIEKSIGLNRDTIRLLDHVINGILTSKLSHVKKL